MTKLPALVPDDPLRASTMTTDAQPPDTPAASAADRQRSPDQRSRADRRPATPPRRRPPTRRSTPTPARAPSPQITEQEWSGATDVTTFRLPAELLHRLHHRTRQLGLAKGMTVAAALIALLARDDHELVALVEQTQQRYDTARRRARRVA